MRLLFGLAAVALAALTLWLGASLIGWLFAPGGAARLGPWLLLALLVAALVPLLLLRLRRLRRKLRKSDDDPRI